MNPTLDGLLNDWTAADRLDSAGTSVSGYEIYGRFSEDVFFFALLAPVAIGANTTFWLNTDKSIDTGYKVWGFASGAEFNVNFGADGVPRLYTGADGQTFVANLTFARSADGRTLELALPKTVLGAAVQTVDIHADINNSVFLPADFTFPGYRIAEPVAPTGPYDGLLNEWTAEQRLDGSANAVAGFEIYGRVENDSFVFGVQSPVVIGANTTFWLNTDGQTSTGYQIWGWAGGAEFNVNIGADGVARLYSGADGQTLVGNIDYAIAPDGRSIEFAVPRSLIGVSVSSVTMLADINNSIFIPASYGTQPGYVLTDTGTLPPSSFDGLLTEWTADQRLDSAANAVSGYEIYGRAEPDRYVFAMKSAVEIGPNTTFWLNTDDNQATGHQIWGFAGGAEYNINFGADGIARLYTGAAGEVLVGTVDFALSPDKLSIEFAVTKSQVGNAASVTMLADVNDSIFLPSSYAGMPGFRLEGVTSTHDGLLTEWTAADRLETPLTATAGYELYGKYAGGDFVFALKSDVVIGPNTTFWFNTDNDASTGYKIFGSAGGAEYNVNIGADGVARLYTGGAGETLLGAVDYRIGPDGKTIEFSLSAATLGGASKIGMLADVNDSVFLPGDYTRPQFTVQDPATLVQPTYDGQKIAIVYSATTAGAFFSEMAYSQLIMAAQSQAMAAGVPYDLISEADLTNINLLVNYDAIVFPSFRNAPANYAEIAATLQQLVYDHGKSLITAGDFMTNDGSGAALPGNPYERMETLLGVHRTGGDSGVTAEVVAASGGHPITQGYGAGGSIYTYNGISTSYFDAFNPGFGDVTTIATQVVNGTSHNAVLGSTTGGRNVSFATESLLADSNLLGRAIDWVTGSDTGPEVSLRMSRHSEIVASRNDMDQSQETFDVDGGIYDTLLPILEQWKAQYGFVGSYYVNVGLNPPDQETNWTISGEYYQRLLAMGNEIGSHSYTHPEDTNVLLPQVVTQAMLDAVPALNGMSVATFNATLQAALDAPDPAELDAVSKAVLAATFEFQFSVSRDVIAQQLGIEITGAAVPGMPEGITTAREIMQYYADYLSGGASMIGAGYPGAMGYLSPDDQGVVYIAPNMSFDFTLTDWLGLTPEQAILKWEEELGTLRTNSDLPIIVWPWHDYGATEWPLDEGVPSKATLEMFTSVVAAAYGAGAEFVTLKDLSQRIRAFERTDFGYTVNGDVITVKALPTTGGLGTFALDLDELGGKSIARVNGWYAYDEDSVFLDSNGGTYEIALGAAPDDVTHITRLGQRAKLDSVTGDGENLAFTVVGEGQVVVSLKLTDGHGYLVSGATVASLEGDVMTLQLAGIGNHSVTLQNVPMVNNAASDIMVANLAAVVENTAARFKVADLTVIDNDAFPTLRNNIVTVDDPRFEIDPVDGGLYLKAGQTIDYEAAQTINLTLSATDGPLIFTKPLAITVVNANDAPMGGVSIVGTTTVGQILTANTTTLGDQDGLGALSFQWQRNVAGTFVPITGATTATYALAAGDVATAIRVVVSYTDGGGMAETVTSAATAPVAPVPVVMAPSVEDQIRIITVAELTGGAAATVSNLVASSGTLAANPDGSWRFTPALNDDTAVTFTYRLTTSAGNVTATASLDLVGMTDVLGTGSANTLAGLTTADQYHGGGGNDTISGGDGNDILFGDAGADRVNGDNGDDVIVATPSDGNDIYNGGAGVDTYDLARTTAAATVRLDTGTASSSQTGTDSLSNIENVVGGAGSDTITGSSAANWLLGGFGNDTLNGGGGTDTLEGGWGNDRLSGGAARDVLIGGAGNDTFIFTAVGDTAPTAAGRDFVSDFVKGQDRIDLSAIDANSLNSGNQAFVFLPTAGAAFTGTRGQLAYAFSDLAGTADDRTIVAGDVNGDRVADFQIEVNGLISFGSGDFIL